MVTHSPPIDCESNFIRLPTEILVEIVKDVASIQGYVNDHDEYVSIAESTKETHCDYLNTQLFGNIYLEPTRACLTSIQCGDFSRVAQHVHSITFTTPPGWTLSYKTYERIIHNSEETSVRPSSEAIMAGYDAYIRDARHTQALLEHPDSELKQAWTRVLKMIGNSLEQVRLLSHDCEAMRRVEYLDNHMMVGSDIPWQLPRHNHNDNRLGRVMGKASDDGAEYECKNGTAVAGDKLLAAVISCLAASGVAIAHLAIQMYMAGDLECKTIPGWEQLDFSKLKKLQISPEIPSGENGLVEGALFAHTTSRAEMMKLKAGDVFHDLIDKCHSSIEYLSFGVEWAGKGVITWPTRHSTYEFPKLRHFAQGSNFSPRLLSCWIIHMQNLRHLDLAGALCRGPDYMDWRYVFYAIRCHFHV